MPNFISSLLCVTMAVLVLGKSHYRWTATFKNEISFSALCKYLSGGGCWLQHSAPVKRAIMIKGHR